MSEQQAGERILQLEKQVSLLHGALQEYMGVCGEDGKRGNIKPYALVLAYRRAAKAVAQMDKDNTRRRDDCEV